MRSGSQLKPYVCVEPDHRPPSAGLMGLGLRTAALGVRAYTHSLTRPARVPSGFLTGGRTGDVKTPPP